MKTEFVKVEIDRYEDLVIAEEQLRSLKNIILRNLKYSPIVERLTVDEDKTIIAYLSSICAFDLNELLLDEKAKLENEEVKLEEKNKE